MASSKSTIISALSNRTAVGFVKSVLKSSYGHFFAGHRQEAQRMVEEAFRILLSSLDSGNRVEGLRQAVVKVNGTVFRKGEPSFWFNILHRHYKTHTRSLVDYRCISPFISGKKVLDFGSNGGYFALELEKHGYEVITTDVMDYRDASAKHLPFRKMDSSTVIPYENNAADTAIVKTVFHHIDPSDMEKIMGELNRVAARIIVKEDMYGVDAATPGIAPLLGSQPELRQYVQLSAEDQYDFLVLIDFFGNIVAHGLIDMHLAFNFHRIGSWKEYFGSHGYKVQNVQFYGFENTKLHNSLQAWIVCDRIA